MLVEERKRKKSKVVVVKSERELTHWVRLNLSMICNGKCQFCHYWNRDESDEIKTSDVYRLIQSYKQHGMNSIEITGGETTLRHDLKEIVHYAKDYGFKKVILASNGIRLAEKEYFKQLVDAGVDEVILTVQGHRPKLHEMHLMVEDSFSKLEIAISNAQEFGISCQAQTIITGLNYNYLTDISQFLLKSGVKKVRFKTFNPSEFEFVNNEASNYLFTLVASQMQNVVKSHWRDFKQLQFQSVPFCFMQGYEQYVVNLPQSIYKSDGNNFIVQREVKNLLGMQKLVQNNDELLIDSYYRMLNQDLQKTELELQNKTVVIDDKVKITNCAKCRYNLICDGVWRNYIAKNGAFEIKAVPGKEINDPTYFLQKM